MTVKDELEALTTECLEKNNMEIESAIEELTEIISRRPDFVHVLAERFLDHVLLVYPNLLSINDPPDKLPQA